MTEPASTARLAALAEAVTRSHNELVVEVRAADRAGIPKSTIANVTGYSRETIRRWCTS